MFSALGDCSRSMFLCGARIGKQINKKISDEVKSSARNDSQVKSHVSGDQNRSM